MQPKTETLICFLILIFILISGCSTDSDEDNTQNKIIVFAAAGTTDAITEIADVFTEQTAIEVTLNFASSSALAQQINLGADADVFISANQKWADFLQEKQLVAKKETIVKNSIVIIVPKNTTLSNDSPEILLSDDIKHIAMGETSSVPVGRYGKEALENLGLWKKIEKKVVSAKDVRSALAYVETEAAEAGIVYYTDTVISDKVKIAFIFPDDALSNPVSFPAIILAKAVHKENANLFFDFLKNDKAVSIFKKYGFQIN
ncbi:MAG: molybdate ABC transporter substrate-binding protein [Sedimentisphaerales bacterium]|nr:molybdate ABC transporter substrate-binding protein [Sedimentisphaerales bacterium]